MTLELLRLPGLQYSSEHKTLVASPALLSNTDVIVPLLKLAAPRLRRSKWTELTPALWARPVRFEQLSRRAASFSSGTIL